MKGKYSDCGQARESAGAWGDSSAAKPLLLHYDTEYREDEGPSL
jgi:hypothetical protein